MKWVVVATIVAFSLLLGFRFVRRLTLGHARDLIRTTSDQVYQRRG